MLLLLLENVLKQEDSDRGNLTLYIKYEQSGSDFESTLFEDGESLLTSVDIVFGVDCDCCW